jgi:hypothetical protein
MARGVLEVPFPDTVEAACAPAPLREDDPVVDDGDDGNLSNKSRLTLTRPQDLGAVLRKMEVRVDGEVAASLRPRQSQIVELEPGSHVVQARLDWASSTPLVLTLAPNEHGVVEVAVSARSYWAWFVRPRSSLAIRQMKSA